MSRAGDLVSPTEPSSSSGSNAAAPAASGAGAAHSVDDDIFAGIDLKPKMEVNQSTELKNTDK